MNWKSFFVIVFFSWLASLPLFAPPSAAISTDSRLDLEKKLAEGESTSLLRTLAKEERLHPDCHWVFCRKGDALKLAGESNLAEVAYTRAIKQDPTCINARICRANLRFNKKRYEDALMDLAPLQEISQLKTIVLEMMAKSHFELGCYRQCVQECDDYMRMFGNRELLHLRAEAKVRLGDLDAAREDQISAKDFPINGTILIDPQFGCSRGDGFDKQSLKHETFADCMSDSQYESRLKVKPPDASHFRFVFIPPKITHTQYSVTGPGPRPADFKSEDGRPWGWKPLRIPRDSIYGYLRDAILLLRQERVADGILVLQKADSLFPKSHQVFCLLGTVLKLQGQKRKAYKAFSRAHELDPDCQTALQKKIEYSKGFGFSPDVITDLRKLMELDGEDSCWLHDIALAEYDIGEFEKCIEDCNDALSTDAINASDLYSLRARANEKLGRLKQADADSSLAKTASHGMRLPPVSSYQCDYFRPVEDGSNWHNRYDEVVNFSYPSSLGDKLFSANYSRKELGSKDEKPDDIAPRHWEFKLEKSGTRFYVFPTFDYRVENFAKAYPPVADAVSELRTILEKKGKAPKRIPFLPWSDSSTPMVSHVKYLKLGNGEAIRYLAAYGIEPDVISNEHLEYVVQGLSKDGRFYISIYVPIKSDALPGRSDVPMMSDDKYAAFSKGFKKYAKQLESKLNKLRDESFRPDLNELDRMASSVAFHDPFFIEMQESKY